MYCVRKVTNDLYWVGAGDAAGDVQIAGKLLTGHTHIDRKSVV